MRVSINSTGGKFLTVPVSSFIAETLALEAAVGLLTRLALGR